MAGVDGDAQSRPPRRPGMEPRAGRADRADHRAPRGQLAGRLDGAPGVVLARLGMAEIEPEARAERGAQSA